MKTLNFAGVTLALLALPTVAMAQNDSGHMGRGMPSVGMPSVGMPSMGMPSMPRPGGMQGGGMHNGGGQWAGGMRAPGGWSAYRPASRGYMLPSYWVSPSFYIGNYSRYGFSTPQSGYGWSRYYNDAVLTDRYGRVHDSVRGVNWDGYEDNGAYGEDYSDSYGYRDEARPVRYEEEAAPRRKSDGGIIGAVVGGVVGAVAGNLIAGPGNRLAGSLIGGGVGLLGGHLIGKASERRGERYVGDRNARDYEVRDRRNLPYDNGYRGRGQDGDVTADGRWSGTYERNGNRGRPSHWVSRGGEYGGPRTVYSGGGYGYGGGETVVTIQSAPVVTTTTYTTEEVVYASAPRRRVAVRKAVWRPRPKPRCICGS
jgi:Nickel/cobalt transporter regulator/Glycine zipper 2TM domain